MITAESLQYLFHVLSCAIQNKTPDAFPDNMNVEEFMNFAKMHKLENIVFLTIGDRFPEPLREECQDNYNKSLYIQATQEYYLNEIEEAFEKNGIDYLVLKGREISALYPSEDMRQATDVDIYVGKTNAALARDIMLEMGFSIYNYDDTDDDHDEYTIDGFVMFEIHRVLIQGDYPWQKGCNAITSRLVRCDNRKHCYKMSPEDFYVFNLAHAAKHMKFSGVGIKVFLDQWIIYNKLKDLMDNKRLSQRLKECNLTEFDRNAKMLFEFWFEGKEPAEPEKIKEMAEYVVNSGWIGTFEQKEASELAKQMGSTHSKAFAKINKYFEIIFEPYEFILGRYPILIKHKWLLPFCRIHRAMSALLFSRNVIKKVNARIDDADMSEAKKIAALKKGIGL